MPDLRSSAANRALATELRRLRELAGMSGDEVAGALKWSASKISRIETNRIGVKPGDLARLLDLYAVEDERRGQLTALAEERDPRGWWNAYAADIPSDYGTYISLETSAAQLRCWSPEVIHGLLQTEEYADTIMAILSPFEPPLPPGAIRRRTEVRMRRQELLTGPEQKQFTFLLDEAALVHRYGETDVMRRQLSRLAEASRLPNVTIRVLAFASRASGHESRAVHAPRVRTETRHANQRHDLHRAAEQEQLHRGRRSRAPVSASLRPDRGRCARRACLTSAHNRHRRRAMGLTAGRFG